MTQLTPSNRITHLADLYHRAEMSNGTSVPSNWALTSTGSNFGITWSPQAGGGGASISYGSNAMDVASADNGGSSTDVSRMDHRHRGVTQITAAGSNALVGNVNFVGGGSVGVTIAGQTVQFSGPGNTSSGAGGAAQVDPFYGDGRDGDVTISGDTTIIRDMYYNNLTVNGGVNLDTALLRVFVRGTLTLNGTIRCNGNNGGTGGNGTGAAGGAAGAAGTQQSGGSVQTFPSGGTGRAGSTGGINANGQNGIAGGNTTYFGIVTPAGTAGGISGSGRSGGTGGGAGTGDESANEKPLVWPQIATWKTTLTGNTNINMSTVLGIPATGGGGGGAAGAGGGGSGGSGSSGGIVFVCAKTITGSGTIQSKGGNGGTGGNGFASGQAGGGAGGNGGQGGIAILITKDVSGWTGSFDVAGGTKGTGGTAGGGAGSTNGSDGNNGNAGRSFQMLLG